MQSSEKKQFSLKYIHNDQSSRLQQRYQNEAQLLEDLRLFTKQKCTIDKAYGHSLVKLSQQFLSKLPQSLLAKHHKRSDGQNDSTLLTDAWKTYLLKAEEVGKIRAHNSDAYVDGISDVCKLLRNHRSQVAKLVFDYLSEHQKGVLQSTQDAQKIQKSYKEKFQKTKECGFKMKGLNERMKGSSAAKLQTQHAQVMDEMRSCEGKSDTARNNYLLDLASANSQLREYYNSHLPEIIQLIDGEFYEDWKKFLFITSGIEKRICHEIVRCCDDVNNITNKVSRDYDVYCFISDNPCITEVVETTYAPHNGDETSKVVVTKRTEMELEKEARKYSIQTVREATVVEKCNGELAKFNLENMGIEERTKEFEMYFNLRRVIQESKTKREKALSRLKTLRDGGVNVDIWLSDANKMQPIGKDEDANSFDSCHDDSTSTTNVDGCFNDEDSFKTSENPNDGHSSHYPYWCSSLYDYEGINTDELTFKAEERLKMVGDGCGDGWLWAENESGNVGLVPQNYISTYQEPLAGERSNENDLSTNNISILRTAPPPPNKKDTFKDDEVERNSDLSLSTQQSSNENAPTDATIEDKTANLVKLGDKEVFWVRALYDYEATCDEELTFSEGQLIKVTKTSRDVDDGWWQGEVKGQTGIFPSMIVEEVFVVTPTKITPNKGNFSATNWKSSINLSIPVLIGKEPDVVTSNSPAKTPMSKSDENSNNNNNNDKDSIDFSERCSNRNNISNTIKQIDDYSSIRSSQSQSPDKSAPSFDRYCKLSKTPPSNVTSGNIYPSSLAISNSSNSNNSNKTTTGSPVLAQCNNDSYMVQHRNLGDSNKLDTPKSRGGHCKDQQVTGFSTLSIRNSDHDTEEKYYNSSTSNRPNTSYYSASNHLQNQSRSGGIGQQSPQQYQQLNTQQHHYDFSTVPRSQKQPGTDQGHVAATVEFGKHPPEMTDSGIEIRSNYLSLGSSPYSLSGQNRKPDYDYKVYRAIGDYTPPTGGRGATGHFRGGSQDTGMRTLPIQHYQSPPRDCSSSGSTNSDNIIRDKNSRSLWIANEMRESYI